MAFFRGDMAAWLAAAAQAPRDAGAAARRVLEDPSYQRELPGDAVRRVLENPTYQRELPAEAPPVDLPNLELSWLGRLLEILFWAVVIVVAAVLVVWLVNRLLSRRARDLEIAVDDADAPVLDVRLDQPDRLAAAGRFAEAIHQLLLETLAALSRASQLPASFTSREVLARVALPARAREALAGLVQAVEISRFGGAPATADDYQECMARFRDFQETYRGRAEPAPGAAA